MLMKALTISAGLALASAAPVFAVPLGQPLFVAEADGTGSILDFFFDAGPSGLKELDASATITEEYGATGFIGSTIAYSMDLNGIGSLSLGSLALDIETFTAGYAGGLGDVFADTGLISTTFLVEFPIDSFEEDPVTGDFTFMLDLDPFGTDLIVETRDFPFVEIGVNIFYDGPLPTRTFDDGIDPFEFIEGPFTPTRIEVGLIGGEPVAPVPLPAGGLLLAGVLAGFAGLRRRKAMA